MSLDHEMSIDMKTLLITSLVVAVIGLYFLLEWTPFRLQMLGVLLFFVVLKGVLFGIGCRKYKGKISDWL